MIQWLIQPITAHPSLADGRAPSGLLAEREQIRLAELKSEKRRCDWLLGRWTAKHLLQSYVERRTGVRPPLDALVVASDPDGAPRVLPDCSLNLQSVIDGLRLSISHRDGYAFCALSDAGLPIGADIERIEPRAPGFAEDYFTDEELALLRGAQPAYRDMLVTLIWSAKEAALKALRLGLTVDTRSVECMPAPGVARESGWAALGIRCVRSLPCPAELLGGWWQVRGPFVLTLAAAGHDPAPRSSSSDCYYQQELRSKQTLTPSPLSRRRRRGGEELSYALPSPVATGDKRSAEGGLPGARATA